MPKYYVSDPGIGAGFQALSQALFPDPATEQRARAFHANARKNQALAGKYSQEQQDLFQQRGNREALSTVLANPWLMAQPEGRALAYSRAAGAGADYADQGTAQFLGGYAGSVTGPNTGREGQRLSDAALADILVSAGTQKYQDTRPGAREAEAAALARDLAGPVDTPVDQRLTVIGPDGRPIYTREPDPGQVRDVTEAGGGSGGSGKPEDIGPQESLKFEDLTARRIATIYDVDKDMVDRKASLTVANRAEQLYNDPASPYYRNSGAAIRAAIEEYSAALEKTGADGFWSWLTSDGVRMIEQREAGDSGGAEDDTYERARQAIEQGADPEAVRERLRQGGYDPSRL